MTETAIAILGSDEIDQLGPDVPERWCETTLIPWADRTTNFDDIADAHTRMSAMEAAYEKLGQDVLELTKARRYLELRAGEMFLEHFGEQGQPSGGFDENACRKMARNKQLVVDMIDAATDPATLSRASVLRAIKHADPDYRAERAADNKRRRERRDNIMKQVSKAEEILDRETQRRAAKRRGDHVGKSWSLIENLLIEIDHAVDDALNEGNDERMELLIGARLLLHDAWDLLGQAVRIP